MDNFVHLTLLAEQYQQAILSKDFEKANNSFTELSNQLNLIEDFSVYTLEQINWFNQLNQDINRQVVVLEEQSQILIEQIKPFNKKVSGYL